MRKVNLGGSLYATFEGSEIALTVESKGTTANTIILSPEIIDTLSDFITICKEFNDHFKPGIE